MSIKENKTYLKQRLQQLLSSGLIDHFTIDESDDKTFSIVFIKIRKSTIEFATNFANSMELTINNYFRDVTDYVHDDLKTTIDWYIDLLRAIGKQNFRLLKYTRNKKIICWELVVDGDNQVVISDFKNHLKLFSKKQELPPASLDSIKGAK